MRLIAALAYPGMQLLDLAGPLEAFNLAAQRLKEEGESHSRAYGFAIITKDGKPATSMSGLALQANRSLGDPIAGIDTLIIPGALTGDEAFFTDPELIAFVRRASRKVRRMCSVCSGAFLLAAAGLLDGRRATTHWMDTGELQKLFPKVRVEPDQIYIEDGGIYTSGGITAGIDLALALIEEDHSRRLALQTAKRLLVFLKRPGNQLQFNRFLADQVEPTRFDELLQWMTPHLDEDLRTSDLAKRACMSERSFRRHFQAEMGMSASQYLAQARMVKAQALLESTGLTIADISRRCGFRSPSAMRQVFLKTVKATPGAYRQRFGGPGRKP